IAFAADGALLTAGPLDSRLQKWDAATGARVWQTEKLIVMPQRLAIAPDGRTAAGVANNRLTFWDVATGRLLRSDAGHAGMLRPKGVAFGPDGRRVFTEAWDGTRREWDATTGRPRGVEPTFV